MTQPALLPCPFCGESADDPRLVRASSETTWFECRSCEASGPVFRHRPTDSSRMVSDGARKSWNERP